MNKIKSQSRGFKRREFTQLKQNHIKGFRNPYQEKLSLIDSITVVHPLIDRLIEIKMAKCLQHGNVYQNSHQKNEIGKIKDGRYITLEAPTISGSMKKIERRPPTSRLKIDWTGVKTTNKSSRPKTTNTIVRSRTSEPRITRKLELISKQHTYDEEEENDLKPSFMSNKIRRVAVNSANLIDQQ